MSSQEEEEEEMIQSSDEEEEEIEFNYDEDSTDLPVNVFSCLLLNQVYQRDLQDLIEFIENRLRLNKILQNELNSSSMKIEEEYDIDENLCEKKFIKSNNSLNAFASPYFKDLKGLHAPPNNDTITKKINNELNYAFICPMKIWTETDKCSLIKQVKSFLLGKTLNPLIEKKTKALRNVDYANSLEEKENYRRIVNGIDEEINLFTTEPDLTITAREKSNEIDWLLIATRLDLNYSDFECEIIWRNELHPSVNKEKWTENEIEKLKLLVSSYGNDWNAIAIELGTSRLPWQCFKYYQSNLNLHINRKGPLTDAEAAMVNEVISQCRIGDYIPWHQVNYFIEGRTVAQLKHFWNKINLIKRGECFTELEDEMLNAAVSKYGLHNWKKVSHYLPGRSNRQCRERYMLRLGVKERKLGSFTADEDKKIILLAQKFNQRWVEIEKHFVGRNSRQIASRHEVLYKRYGDLLDKKNIFHLKDVKEEEEDKEDEKLSKSRNKDNNKDVSLMPKVQTRRVYLKKRNCDRIVNAIKKRYGPIIEDETLRLNVMLRDGRIRLQNELEKFILKSFINEKPGRKKQILNEDDQDEDDGKINFEREIVKHFTFYSNVQRNSKPLYTSIQDTVIMNELSDVIESMLLKQRPRNSHLLSQVIQTALQSCSYDLNSLSDESSPPIIPPCRILMQTFKGLALEKHHLHQQSQSSKLSLRQLHCSDEYLKFFQIFSSLFFWPALMMKIDVPEIISENLFLTQPSCSNTTTTTTEIPTVTKKKRTGQSKRKVQKMLPGRCTNLTKIRDKQNFLIRSANASEEKVVNNL